MREFRTYGSVRGALSNERPYRDSGPLFPDKRACTIEKPQTCPVAAPAAARVRAGRPRSQGVTCPWALLAP